jgi:CBS-domain-containing membrane protein
MYLVLPLLAGNCVCVLVASVFNNAIRGRQYPR